MNRLIGLMAAALLVTACGTTGSKVEKEVKKEVHSDSSFTTPDDKEPARKDVLVQFTDASVTPSVARVLEGGSVGWTNLSDNYVGTVSFQLKDVKAFECKELRPNFMKTDTTLDSIPMQGESVRVSLPCALKKGTYPYVIKLGGNPRQPDNVMFTLQAKLVVE